MSTESSPAYPVVLTGELSSELSRWLCLIKLILIIPHVLLLFLIWIGVGLSVIGAFFAILVTGRYPRGLFDFNLGAMRYTWRVGFYSFAAFATDQYPPFSMDREDDYPATLDIPYPERLSRGLVLVKWILAIPHMIIVSLISGPTGGWSVVGVLAVVAGILMLVKRPYPEDIFELLMDLNGWSYRVTAYVALMTDEYPPFRLKP
ncbi:MAG: DUF4389 domain-containing protein [Chloroflexi bacterium]|nr:DUF4389 domain-containing protein [Chloroflexota bacterium]